MKQLSGIESHSAEHCRQVLSSIRHVNNESAHSPYPLYGQVMASALLLEVKGALFETAQLKQSYVSSRI